MSKSAQWIVIILLAIIAWHIAKPEKPAAKHDYTILQISDMRRDQFVIDKRTGRVWTVVCWDNKQSKDGVSCDERVLQPIRYAPDSVMPDQMPKQLLPGGEPYNGELAALLKKSNSKK